MTVRLVIEDTGFGLRAAALEDGRLVELRDQDAGSGRVTDEIYLARVTGVEPKLNAAFLDCGPGLVGFVTAKDARAAAGGGERRPVRELLREGQRLVVQGLREPADDKGPRFTADVRLFGLALVHTPLNARLEAGASRAAGRREADTLRERAQALFPDGRFAIRRHAAEAPDDALRAEAELLAGRWRLVGEAAAAGSGRRPGRLQVGEKRLERLLRGLLELYPERIEVADTVLWTELRRLAEDAPAFPPAIELARLPEGRPAFATAGVDEELDRALAQDVPLPGGGRLRIETTAAFVAIDVDGGGRAPLDVDLAAATEIARQVRLRNLGGSIVIDFVDLPHKHERHRLEESLKRAFRHDPAPVEVHPMSPLGIVQVSRARRGEPLASRLGAGCPACAGTGRVAAPRLAAERLLKALAGARRAPEAVHAATDLARFLTGEGQGAWARQTARLGHAPRLVAEAGLACGEFRLEGADDGR